MIDKSKKSYEMLKIIENATVIYTSGVGEHLEVIRVIDKGVIIGRIIDGEFLDCGFISKSSIKEIRCGKKREL